MSHPVYRLVSLFAGCGGIDLGFSGGFHYLGKHFSKTGIQLALANDFNHWACETFRINFGSDKIIEGDITEIPSTEFPDPDVITGGFPCQDFSITRANNRGGIEVKRGQLYKEFVRLVADKMPRVFVAENVKGLLTANRGMAIKIIEKDFAELGYIISKKVLKFSDYGVPQIRERVILVGIRYDLDFVYSFPNPVTYKKPITSGTALMDVSKVKLNNDLIPIKEKTRNVIDSIPEGGNNKDTRNKEYFVKGIMSNIYRRLDRNKPSPTIIAGGGGGTWGYHYEEPRPLTNRERARLQSFPDDFEFAGNYTEVRRQIGNAVPPVGAYYIALSILPALEANRKTKAEAEETLKILSKKYFGSLGEDQLNLYG